ncbi:MAG: hypothetical protein Q4B09_00620 [Lachnospiraceae bacterium]|nr:hypothetical protein [Lachnospiraceae bacterium]
MKTSKHHSGPAVPAVFTLLAAVLTLLPFFIRPVYFMVADDYLLNYIANGSYGKDGSAHLVYIRIVLGGLLKGLYTLTTAVNWFLVLLLVLLIVSFAVLYCVVLRSTGHLLPLLPLMVINLSVPVFFLTYTAVAFIVCAAGAGLWYLFFLHGTTRKRNAFVGSILIVTALCLRADSVVPTLLLCSPLFLHLLVSAVKEGRLKSPKAFASVVKNACLPLLLLAALLISTGAAERYAYSDPGWRDFLDYTNARAAVVDYAGADYSTYADAFAEIGLSELDYNLLRAWKYCEKPVYSKEVLEAAAKIGSDAVTLQKRINYAKSSYTLPNCMLFLLPVLLLLILMLLYPGYPAAAGLLTIFFYEGVTWALIFIRMRYVIRVAVPLCMIAAFALCMLRPKKKDAEDASAETENAETDAVEVYRFEEIPEEQAAEAADLSEVQASEDEFYSDISAYQNSSADVNAEVKAENEIPYCETREYKRALLVLRIFRYAAALLLVVIAAAGGLLFIKDYRANNWVSRVPHDGYPKVQVTEAIYEDQDTLYVIDAGLLSILYYFGTEAKDVLTTDRFANVARSGSWDSFSPRYYNQVGSYLTDPDRLLSGLGTEKQLAYVATAEGAMRQFVTEQTGRTYEPEIREFPDMSTKIYRYHEKTEGKEKKKDTDKKQP